MRIACGLAPRDRSKDKAPGAERLGMAAESQEESAAAKAHDPDSVAVMSAMLNDCLVNQRDTITRGMFKYLTLPRGVLVYGQGRHVEATAG